MSVAHRRPTGTSDSTHGGEPNGIPFVWLCRKTRSTARLAARSAETNKLAACAASSLPLRDTRSGRKGSAMIDVVAASIVTVMMLVPSVSVMRRSMQLDRRLLLRQEMVTRVQQPDRAADRHRADDTASGPPAGRGRRGQRCASLRRGPVRQHGCRRRAGSPDGCHGDSVAR